MKHFLGTRFNLKVPDWKTTKNGTTVLDETWLQDRFELFEKYCFPSVKNQSTQDFIWFVFFDIDTPEKYKKRVKVLTQEYISFKPVFVDGIQNLQSQFLTSVKAHLDENDTYVITTRMDNDDLLHRDFIKTVQLLYEPSDGAVIDMQNGFQVTLSPSNSEIRNYPHPFNAFVSVIESVENIETIYSKMHYDWKHVPRVISYKKRKLWIELVHETNKVNHTISNLKKAYTFDKDDFGLSARFMFQIDTFDVFKTNLLIDVQRFRKIIKQLVYKLSRMPFRAKRYLKKKIKFYALEYGLIKSKSKWPYISKRLKQKFISEVNLLSSEETLDIIKKTIESKIAGAYLRFGDGDVLLMMGENDSLHDVNSNLSQEMGEAFRIQGDYVHKSLPINSNLFGFEKGMKGGLHLVRDIDALKYLAVTYKNININQIFSTVALHHVSTINSLYCIAFLKFLKSQNPIFVGNHNIDKNIVDKLFGNIHIKTPPNNSYNEINRIEQELLEVLDNINEFKAVVVAMGCPGRILQKRIIKKGYNVYLFDFGSLLDAFNGEQTRAWVRLTGGVNSYMDLLNEI